MRAPNGANMDPKSAFFCVYKSCEFIVKNRVWGGHPPFSVCQKSVLFMLQIRWNKDFLLQKSSAFPMGILQKFILVYFNAFRDQGGTLPPNPCHCRSLRYRLFIYLYLVKVIYVSDRNSSGILEGFHCKGIKNFWLVRHITSNPLPLPVVEIDISFATESISRSHLLFFQSEFFWNSWRTSLLSVTFHGKNS